MVSDMANALKLGTFGKNQRSSFFIVNKEINSSARSLCKDKLKKGKVKKKSRLIRATFEVSKLRYVNI